jgi:UDP-N-acetylglucosamine--N-acetylmuramyl-(pentapeptide) pyrophosphoryl-undecaprenol N-acetylglucosamine transferase
MNTLRAGTASELPLLVVTGGGSGGHTMPALAVAEYAESHRLARVVYIGGSNGIEGDAARRAGIPFHAVRTGKLRRASTPLGLLQRQNLADIPNVALGVVDGYRLLRRLEPAAVLGTGGYVAVPVLVAAAVLRIPATIHEQTVQFGLANRLTAPLVEQIALSSPLSLDMVPERLRRKATVVGLPIRGGVLTGSAENARTRFGIDPDLPTVLILGGAQGSETINRAALAALESLLERCNVVHQAGAGAGLETTAAVLRDHHERLAAMAGAYWVGEFLEADALGDAYAAATVAVSRSGAGTTNELAATGTPAVLVPLVPTGGDEQRKIALYFSHGQAAVVVPNADLDGPMLATSVHRLLDEPGRLEAMSAAARALYLGDATEALVSLALRPLG